MFEHEQAIVNELLNDNPAFRRIYEKHSQLNAKVDRATTGEAPIEHFELETMKKEKLMLRDKLQAMIHARSARH
jgi:uncharacterized protein YdcH (DUF465 family)